jgi:hypothetical protein
MALNAMSQDEIAVVMADTYDSLLAQAAGKPMKIWRNNNNKLYLIFRAIAAGIALILDAVIALKNRFNPALCDDTDLYSIAKLVGTEVKKGAGSILRITVANESEAEQKTLPAGEYRYSFVSGMVFTFTCEADLLFTPGEEKIVFAVSAGIGSYHVTGNSDIAVARVDGIPIDPALNFSCADNAGSLGYPDEDSLSFRQRILNGRLRHDHIREIELQIRNLPGILECTLVFNQNNHASDYDGLTLAPMELLVVITGSPTNKIADVVASNVLYQTHFVDSEHVVYYDNDYYIGGRYPVYFMFHASSDFSLEITYRYDTQLLWETQIEDAVTAALKRFKNSSEYVDIITEEMFYKLLSVLNLAGVRFINIDILSGTVAVPYLEIPRTRLPNLINVFFTAIETGGAV